MLFRFNQRTFLWLLLVVSVLVVVSIQSSEARAKSSKHIVKKEKEEDETSKSLNDGNGGEAGAPGDEGAKKEGGEAKEDGETTKKPSEGSRTGDSMSSPDEKAPEEGGDMKGDKGDDKGAEGAGGAAKKDVSSRTSDSAEGPSGESEGGEEDAMAKKPSKGSRTSDSMKGDSMDSGDMRSGDSEGAGEEKADENSEGGNKQQAAKGSRAGAVNKVPGRKKTVAAMTEADVPDEGDKMALLGPPSSRHTGSRSGLSEESGNKGAKHGAKKDDDGEAKGEEDGEEGKGSRTGDEEMTPPSSHSEKKESEEGEGDEASKAKGSRASTTKTKKKSKSKKSKKKKESEDDDESDSEKPERKDDEEGDSDAEGSRISGGWTSKSEPPGWITQVREDMSGTIAGGCSKAHLLGFALRLADQYLLMNDDTFEGMNYENRPGGMGTRPGKFGPPPNNFQPAGSTDFVMMPIQHPVPRKINVGGLGQLGTKECMYKMGFDMNQWDQKPDNFSVYKYDRQGHVAAYQFEEEFDYAHIERDQEKKLENCELLGWSEYVTDKGDANKPGTWEFEFVRLPIEVDYCDEGKKHCYFIGKNESARANLCTNDVGLPIVCGLTEETQTVRFVVGLPLPYGKCARVPIKGVNVAWLLKSGSKPFTWKNPREIEVQNAPG